MNLRNVVAASVWMVKRVPPKRAFPLVGAAVILATLTFIGALYATLGLHTSMNSTLSSLAHKITPAGVYTAGGVGLATLLACATYLTYYGTPGQAHALRRIANSLKSCEINDLTGIEGPAYQMVTETQGEVVIGLIHKDGAGKVHYSAFLSEDARNAYIAHNLPRVTPHVPPPPSTS